MEQEEYNKENENWQILRSCVVWNQNLRLNKELLKSDQLQEN